MLVKGRRIKKVIPPSVQNDYVGSYTLSDVSIPEGNVPYIETDDWIIKAGTLRSGDYLGFSGTDPSYDATMFVKSKRVSRDMEVSFDTSGFVILRDNGVNGVLFKVKWGTETWVEISRASMAIEEFHLNHYHQIYNNTNANSLFDAVGEGDGSGLRVGAVGVELYIKWNGVKIVSVTDWDILNTGSVSFINNNAQWGTNISISATSVTHLSRVSLYSDTDNHILDVRDFDIKADAHFSGSMSTADPYKLIWNSSETLNISYLKVGMVLSVSVGGEAAFHGRSQTTLGIKGVGGFWPQTSFSSIEEMNAVTDKPDTFICWLETTGETYRTYGGIWYRVMYTNTVNQAPNPWNNYPIGYARAYDLRATIVAINGNEITLDTPCQANTTNAEVWVDSWRTLDWILRGALSGDDNLAYSVQPKKIVMPLGRIFISQELQMSVRPGWIFEGQGSSTEFYAPRGCLMPRISGTGSHNTTIQNFDIRGNYKNEDWGIRHYDFRGPGNYNFPNDYGIGGDYFAAYLSGGVTVGAGGNNCLVKNIHTHDMSYGCFGLSTTENSVIEFCSANYSKDPHLYAGWAVGLNSGAVSCIVRDFELNHIVRFPAFEAFGSYNNEFIRITTKNGWFASNSGVNMVIRGCYGLYEQGTLPSNQVINQPIVNINGNNGYGFGGAALVENNHFVIYGEDPWNNNQNCIVVQSGRDGCVVRNNLIEYMSVAASDAMGKYAVGISSDGLSTIIEDNTVNIPVAARPPLNYPGNVYPININTAASGSGNVIRRNTAYAIGAPINQPSVVDIVTTGPDANNVDYIIYDYQIVWQKP